MNDCCLTTSHIYSSFWNDIESRMCERKRKIFAVMDRMCWFFSYMKERGWNKQSYGEISLSCRFILKDFVKNKWKTVFITKMKRVKSYQSSYYSLYKNQIKKWDFITYFYWNLDKKHLHTSCLIMLLLCLFLSNFH